jgi:hypothetical protein
VTVHYPEQIAQVLAQPPAEDPTQHSLRATMAFRRACQLTGLSGAELCRRLGPEIGKRSAISRQTLADWKRGRRAVPMVAFLAACELAGLRPPMIFALANQTSVEPLVRRSAHSQNYGSENR